METIKLFVNKLSLIINDASSTFNIRYNEGNEYKFNLKNTLYASALILNSKGIETVMSDLETDNIVYAGKNALIKKRNDEKTNLYFKKINDKLLNIFYDQHNNFIKNYSFKLDPKKSCYIETNVPDNSLFINKTKKRLIGCDGMQLNVNMNAINNDDIKCSKNKNYGVILISGLYDIINKIPISYYPTHSDEDDFKKKKVNETKGFLQQIDKLNNNDIIVFDRWYFSDPLHKTLKEKNIGYIFRMKNNSKIFKNMYVGKSNIIKLNGVQVQLFKYKIKNENYNILTSITENITIGEIKALYWRRWKIETDNKKFKYDLLRNNIRSKNYNSIATDIECIKFMSILSSIIEYIGKYKCPENKKINSTNCIHLLYKKILYLLFYDPTNYDEICRIVGIVYKKLIPIIIGRSFARIRISPSTKWNAYGNRHGNNNK
jgi:hypothetical protein